jgi:hypothetical protein
MQNIKNFIRHGKQARNAEPTTNISPVHAQQLRHDQYGSPARDKHGISEPNMHEHQKPLQDAVHGEYSLAAGGDNRNVAAKAGDAAARAAEDKQKRERVKQEVDPQVLERIVAEERESKGKLPRYPGLERFSLIEKMGDGAFSNVYRAKDNTGQFGEVAIKVVRKFEMNASQVCLQSLSCHSCQSALRALLLSFAHLIRRTLIA